MHFRRCIQRQRTKMNMLQQEQKENPSKMKIKRKLQFSRADFKSICAIDCLGIGDAFCLLFYRPTLSLSLLQSILFYFVLFHSPLCMRLLSVCIRTVYKCIYWLRREYQIKIQCEIEFMVFHECQM